MKVLDAVINTAQGWKKPPMGIVLRLKSSYGIPGANVAWPKQQFDGFALLPAYTWVCLDDLNVVEGVNIFQFFERNEFEDWVRDRVEIELLCAYRNLHQEET